MSMLADDLFRAVFEFRAPSMPTMPIIPSLPQVLRPSQDRPPLGPAPAPAALVNTSRALDAMVSEGHTRRIAAGSSKAAIASLRARAHRRMCASSLSAGASVVSVPRLTFPRHFPRGLHCSLWSSAVLQARGCGGPCCASGAGAERMSFVQTALVM
jgi:hypothetical protein